jgi:hypothetical protein
MKNSMIEKLTSRFFRKVEDAVWDMTTGKLALKQGDSVLTLEGADEKDAQVSENMFAALSVPVPAFAQQLPLAEIKFGDIIYGDKGALGWVIKKTAKSVTVMTKQGQTTSITPRKVVMLGGNGDTLLVLRSLISMAGGTEQGFMGMQQSMLPMLMLMGDNDKADGDMLSTMLMMQMMGGAGGQQAGGMNPMMLMMMMMKGKDFF